MQRSSFDMKIYCTIVAVVKYRKIFQVYNNNNNISTRVLNPSNDDEIKMTDGCEMTPWQ